MKRTNKNSRRVSFAGKVFERRTSLAKTTAAGAKDRRTLPPHKHGQFAESKIEAPKSSEKEQRKADLTVLSPSKKLAEEFTARIPRLQDSLGTAANLNFSEDHEFEALYRQYPVEGKTVSESFCRQVMEECRPPAESMCVYEDSVPFQERSTFSASGPKLKELDFSTVSELKGSRAQLSRSSNSREPDTESVRKSLQRRFAAKLEKVFEGLPSVFLHTAMTQKTFGTPTKTVIDAASKSRLETNLEETFVEKVYFMVLCEFLQKSDSKTDYDTLLQKENRLNKETVKLEKEVNTLRSALATKEAPLLVAVRNDLAQLATEQKRLAAEEDALQTALNALEQAKAVEPTISVCSLNNLLSLEFHNNELLSYKLTGNTHEFCMFNRLCISFHFCNLERLLVVLMKQLKSKELLGSAMKFLDNLKMLFSILLAHSVELRIVFWVNKWHFDENFCLKLNVEGEVVRNKKTDTRKLQFSVNSEGLQQKPLYSTKDIRTDEKVFCVKLTL